MAALLRGGWCWPRERSVEVARGPETVQHLYFKTLTDMDCSPLHGPDCGLLAMSGHARSPLLEESAAPLLMATRHLCVRLWCLLLRPSPWPRKACLASPEAQREEVLVNLRSRIDNLMKDIEK